MKKLHLIIFACLCACALRAGVTTYTFTSTSWASSVGATPTDGQTDGWVCNMAAYEMGSPRNDAEGRLMYAGVGVKTGTSGAGATSVKSFTNVRSIVVNFCQNSSKGKGVIYFQVGDAPYDSLIVRRPTASGTGVYNRDSLLTLSAPRSGNIRFWINCSENGIYLHSLSIRAEEGGNSPFTQDRYLLVTDAAELRDSDQIILGVPASARIMGYFDEGVSQNNIHAIPGRFTPDGTEVAPNDEAIYTLRTTTWEGAPCFYIQDELRYEEAYLVASGGQTKNRLALWTHLYDDKTYGAYGYWDITIAPDGEATIHNLGNSRSTYLQYNASNTPTLFSCYQAQGMQTGVKIYRRVAALGDAPAIVAPLVNLGTIVLRGGQAVQGEQTILVNANRLSEDIQVSVDNPLFSLSTTQLDRDGDQLTIRYQTATPGKYTATLTFRSDTVVATGSILLNVCEEQTIAEAKQTTDYTQVYLNPVVVTKKYDTYIFVRDQSGSMLLYDNGNGLTGKRYGAGLVAGDSLYNVTGRYLNYYGVPELAPTEAFRSRSYSVAPELAVAAIDSTDVCRYLRLTGADILSSSLVWQGESYPLVDAFNVGIEPMSNATADVVVMYSWDELQLWLVREEQSPTDLLSPSDSEASPAYSILGQPVPGNHPGVVVRKGKKQWNKY